MVDGYKVIVWTGLIVFGVWLMENGGLPAFLGF